MENQNYDFDFNSLFTNPKKKYQVKIPAVITEINSDNEKMSLSVRSLEKNNISYEGLCAIKGEICPTPKRGKIIQINEIHYKLDDNFSPCLFIKLSNIDGNNPNIMGNDIKLDFTEDNIINQLKSLMNVIQILSSNIFIINDDSNEDFYNITCIENNGNYILKKKSQNLDYNLKKNDIIFIVNYFVDKTNIKLTVISLIEKLTQEKLFMLIEKLLNERRFSQKYIFFGKIVEINRNDKNIILLNYDKQLFQKKEAKRIKLDENRLEKGAFNDSENYNKIEEKEDVGLGQFLILTNYEIEEENNQDEFPKLKENNNSFIFYSNQNLYFSDRIQFNKFSVISFYFLDFSNKNNIYNEIEVIEVNTIKKTNQINNIKKEIDKRKMNIIFEAKRTKNYDYYPIKIKLISKKNGKSLEFQEFNFNLMHGFINKINAYINYFSKNSYFYEYIYYFLDGIFHQKNKLISIEKYKRKNIDIYDNFDSFNRLRFNILNIPFQNECDKKKLNLSNSLMVCQIFEENKNISKTIGLFSIEEIFDNIRQLKDNNIFDIYYNDFGTIFDSLCDLINNNGNQDINKLINHCIDKYNENGFSEKVLDFIKISEYEDEISLSQFKTRIGIILSHYLNEIDEYEMKEIFGSFLNIFKNVYNHKDFLSNLQFLRLFNFLIRRYYENHKNYLIYVVSELPEKSPYLVAYQFNKEEINHISELSRLFMGYLQIDSYILTNILIDKNKNNHNCCSLSLEPLFMLKHHLLQTYEGFFLIESEKENRYAQSIADDKITIINKVKVFEFSNLAMKNLNKIEHPQYLKNHAFAISMEFRHENNSHHKKYQKNINIISPIYYFDKTEIKEINYSKNGKIQGEDGRLIENFIDEDRDVILSLQGDIIYGDLLNYKLFIQKDFTALKERMKKIQNSPDKFGSKKFESNIEKDKDNLNWREFKNDTEEKNYFDEIYRRMKKYGIISISDEEYTADIAINMIKIAEKNNSIDGLPKVLIEIYKRMKNENYKK